MSPSLVEHRVVVVSDELADMAEVIYLDIVRFIEGYSRDWGREKFPSLIQFLRACQQDRPIAPLFLLSERELETVIGTVGVYDLGELQTTKPLLIART